MGIPLPVASREVSAVLSLIGCPLRAIHFKEETILMTTCKGASSANPKDNNGICISMFSNKNSGSSPNPLRPAIR
jgi:hypothetical protein